MTLSVKDCLSFGWTTFKKRPWIFVKVALLLGAVSLAFNILNGVVDFGVRTSVDSLATILFTIALVLITIVSVYVSIVLDNMGLTKFYLNAHDNVEGAKLWDLWTPSPFVKYVLTSFLFSLMFLVGLVLFIIPGVLVALAFGMCLYIVMDRGLGPIEALKESRRITRGNRWKLFLLGLAVVGINLVGAILLLVGLFVSIPVTVLAGIHAYRTLSDAKTVPAVV